MSDDREDIRNLLNAVVTVGQESEQTALYKQLRTLVWPEEGLAQVAGNRDDAHGFR